MKIKSDLTPSDLLPAIRKMWEVSAPKISVIEDTHPPGKGAPVYTVRGIYTSRGWTEWTQGFQYGSSLLQYDATGEESFLEVGRDRTRNAMPPHLTHSGVHDHGFNNVSTYGNLLRLIREGRIDDDPAFYELALKCSGAVQARRWTSLPGDLGYIHSFNGPHSLFADTIRTLRAPAIAHSLGHFLMGENDKRISLLGRVVRHLNTTARFAVYYGEGRDLYDVRGRVAHESIFNTNDGNYRCPNSQQGYSPFTTWTRGHSWVLLGAAEQLEWIASLAREGMCEAQNLLARMARATADFYLEQTPLDGIPYWDTGAPGLTKMGDVLSRPAEPFNDYEPVDSSAAAIAAQGLIRLGHYFGEDHYFKAGLTVLETLLQEPYLCFDPDHQGLLLHSIYHRPNNWDHIPEGRKVPCGEACQWGDYHLREAALLVQRLAEETSPYYTFFGPKS